MDSMQSVSELARQTEISAKKFFYIQRKSLLCPGINTLASSLLIPPAPQTTSEAKKQKEQRKDFNFKELHQNTVFFTHELLHCVQK